jgi:hypothetical protein
MEAKILSFEEFVQKQSEETTPELTQMPGEETDMADETPAPAEEPEGEETDKNLSVNMMASEEPAETGNEPTIEVEPGSDDIESHVD